MFLRSWPDSIFKFKKETCSAVWLVLIKMVCDFDIRLMVCVDASHPLCCSKELSPLWEAQNDLVIQLKLKGSTKYQ